MTRLPPLNDYERSVEDNIASHGWHCTNVTPTPTSSSKLPFSYTVGLHHSYRQPEFIVIGLDSGRAYAVLRDLASAAASGNMVPLDRPSDVLVGGLSCAFIPVPESRYSDYVYSALWYYSGPNFPLVQVVWPNDEGLYPWNQGALAQLLEHQPVLALRK